MLKRGLSLLIFLVLLSSIVCAWSTLSAPSPAIVYEGSDQIFNITINNVGKPLKVKEVHVSLPNVNITNEIM